jgi:hypothetical protein
LAASTSSLSPEPKSVRVVAVDGRSDAVGAKEDDSRAVEVAYLDGPWLAVECHLVRGVGRQRGVLAAIDRVVRNRRWPLLRTWPTS